MSRRPERRAAQTSRRVLVVDDEPDIRVLLELTLARMGLGVDAVGSIAEAKERLKADRYDLCLTDMRLADGEGLELVRHISALPADLPVAVITAWVGQLAEGGEETKPLAGGHSLLPLMKLRVATPETLVDIGRLPGMSEIELDGDTLRIGALTTHAAVVRSDVVHSSCPLLGETASMIGDHQVRNRGTIGGSLAHADPAADYPSTMVALGAGVVTAGPDGERSIAAPDLFVDIMTTSLQPGELITRVDIPVQGAGRGGAYVKHRHPASSYAVVGVAALVTVDDGTCSDTRLVVGGVSGTPVRVTAAEDSLNGEAPSDEAIAAAAAQVSGAITDPIGDVYASGDFRVHLAGVLAKKALAKAAQRSTEA